MRDSAERKFCSRLKVRPAVGAEGDQLSVDHRLLRKILEGRRNVREPLVEHILPAGIKRSHPARSHYLKSIAIEFDFISPFRSIGQFGDSKTIHRLDETRGLLGQCLLVWHGTPVYAAVGMGRAQDVLMVFRPPVSSKTPPHFGHWMMCDARRISSFG